MRIGVPGWGSLIWDLRDLEIEDHWHVGGLMLPVEFAEKTPERGSRKDPLRQKAF
jgi:hypothetical protein